MALLRWQQNIVDEEGNVLPSATVEIRDEVSGSLVNLFEDIDGVTPKGNPLTADSDGYGFAYMEPGRFKITATSADQSFTKSWRDVRLANDFSDLDSRINQRVIYAGSVAAMVAGGFSVGSAVETLGYYSPGDGGGNQYEIVAGTTGAADGGSFIDLDNGNQAKGLFSGSINIRQFGATVDGTDDWAEINACKNYAVGVSRDFYTGSGLIGVSAEIDISTAKGVRMIGEGGGFNSDGNFAPATELRALNAIAGAMVRIRSQQSDAFKTTSCGVIGAGINCASLAEKGIHLTSVNSCEFLDISIKDSTVRGFDMDCLDNKIDSGAGDPADGQNNHFDRISVQTASGACIHVGGNDGTLSTVGANFSLNNFGQIQLNIRDNNGFVFGFADGNTLEMLRVFRPSGNTGYGLMFLADDGGASRHARHNVCYHVQTAFAGVFAGAGDGTQPSKENMILGFSYGNTGVDNPPLIEAGATLSYISPRLLYNLGGRLVAANGATDVQLAANVKTQLEEFTNESIRVFNSNNRHVTLNDGTNDWTIGIDSGGNLNITSPTGGDIILGEDLRLVSTTQGTAGAGGGGAVPANAQGYLVVKVNGVDRAIPFFPLS